MEDQELAATRQKSSPAGKKRKGMGKFYVHQVPYHAKTARNRKGSNEQDFTLVKPKEQL